MVKKPITIHLDEDLFKKIQKCSEDSNLSIETLAVETLHQKYDENKLVDSTTLSFWLMSEQLESMIEILETRRILIFSKSNGTPDVKELEKIDEKKHDLKVELQNLWNDYNKLIENGEIHVQKLRLNGS